MQSNTVKLSADCRAPDTVGSTQTAASLYKTNRIDIILLLSRSGGKGHLKNKLFENSHFIYFTLIQ